MPFSPAHKKLFWGQAAGGLVLNFFLNGAAAWALFPPVDTLPIWARANCVAFDTIGTSFFLPLTTCLILTPLVRRALRKGAISGVSRDALPRAVRWLPNNFVARGAVVGLICALFLGPLAAALLSAAGIDALSKMGVTAWKAVYTALLGLLVTPWLGARVLADVPGSAPKQSPN